MTIYIVDLEAVDTRYTKQWKDHLPKQKSQATGMDPEDISGGEVVQTTTPGAFLNFGGTNVDAVIDSPIDNFVTLNPLHRFTHNCTLSNGNLQATGPNQNFPGAAANIALSSGKWYYEFQINTKTSVPMCGIIKNNYVSGGAGRILYRAGGHYVMADGSEPTTPDAYGVGDIIGVAIDLDDAAGKIRFYKNGTLQPVLANGDLDDVKSDLSISTLGGVFP